MTNDHPKPPTSPATYALLGLLATRSWTSYQLTQQVSRSLRFAWPTSSAHLYREQKRLVALGWAAVDSEPAGQRERKRYTITESGRDALRAWLTTPPQEPQIHIEGVLRAFYGDRGDVADLRAALAETGAMARAMHDEMMSIVDEYLEDGGPLWMLEHDIGGPGAERIEHRGRLMFPERLHAVAVAIDAVTRLLATTGDFFGRAADEVETWPTTHDITLTPRTRARLEAIRERGRALGSG